MARKDYLSPSQGAGLRPLRNSTGPERHGEMVNPPRMAKMGGFTRGSKAQLQEGKLKVKRPGFEK